MSARIIGKLLTKIRQISEHGTWFVLRKFFADHVFGTTQYIYLQRDLAIPHKNYVRRRNWTIRVLDGDRDLDLFRVHFRHNIKTITKLFEDGLLAGGAFVDDVLVGYGWFATESFYDPQSGYIIELDENEVYQFDVLLIPKYRGTLIVLDAMRIFHEYLSERGYRRTICLVNLAREGNIKLHLKLGFEEMGAILTSRRLLFWRWATRETYEGHKLSQYSKRPATPAGSTATASGEMAGP